MQTRIEGSRDTESTGKSYEALQATEFNEKAKEDTGCEDNMEKKLKSEGEKGLSNPGEHQYTKMSY